MVVSFFLPRFKVCITPWFGLSQFPNFPGWDSSPSESENDGDKKTWFVNPKNSPGLILLKSPSNNGHQLIASIHLLLRNRSESIYVFDDLLALGSWLSSMPCSSPSLCLSLYLRAVFFFSDHHLGFRSHGDTANSSKSLDQYIYIYMYIYIISYYILFYINTY